jgi:hypothetical protein
MVEVTYNLINFVMSRGGRVRKRTMLLLFTSLINLLKCTDAKEKKWNKLVLSVTYYPSQRQKLKTNSSYFHYYCSSSFSFRLERRNTKGRSGYTFWLILQKTFSAFSHRKLKVVQIWSTHQSKALIFYYGIKNIWIGFLKTLSKTDKLNFIFWNLGCV